MSGITIDRRFGGLAVDRRSGRVEILRLGAPAAGTGGGGGSGVTDGDKGDITVSGGGATWSLDASVITAFARTFLDDTTAAGVRTTLGLGSAATRADTYFQAALGFTPANAADRGQANGYASLDGAGKVPAAQLPAYVDDVLEAANFAALPATGETGKIYVTLDDGKAWRWSGSAYVEISASPGSTDAVPEGSGNLYFTVGRVRATPLAGLTLASAADVVASDTIVVAIGKLQAQLDGLATVASSGSAADLNGNLAVARLNGGTGAGTGTYWRGDGTWAAAPGASVTITVFGASDTFIPAAGLKHVHVIVVGGGGGGGSGRKGAAASDRSGGGAGGGGAVCEATIDAALLNPSGETIIVGGGGAGGAPRTTNSGNGATGSAGGYSAFGAFVRANGGNAGTGGTTTTGGAGAATAVAQYAGGAGGAGSNGNGSVGSRGTIFGASGGGGGGGINTSNAPGTGGTSGGDPTGISGLNSGGGGAAAGVSPAARATNDWRGGQGGGGGGGSTSGNAMTGGNGAVPGAGGGGGGAAVDSVGDSGGGGNGGDGRVIIFSYF